MKREFLVKKTDGSYKLIDWDVEKTPPDYFIEVPEGAECATKCLDDGELFTLFWKGEYKICVGYDEGWFNIKRDIDDYLKDHPDANIVWQREPIDKNEQVLKEILEGGPNQKTVDAMDEADWIIGLRVDQDNVNQPSHYNKGGIECIDAIQSSMTHDAFCGYLKGNVQKYMWRYENKGGVESLKKAQWYLNKLIEVQNGDS